MTLIALQVAEGFGTEQKSGAGILLLCVIVGVAMAIARSDDRDR